MSIIQFFQMILNKRKDIEEDTHSVLYKFYSIDEKLKISEEIGLEAEKQDYQTLKVNETIRKDPWTPEFVLAPYFPSDDNDNKRPGYLDISLRAY